MGKPIAIHDTTVIDEVAVIDTDRSITGQDGAGFATPDEAAAGGTLPAYLAGRLFEGVDGLENVFAASSQVVLRRGQGWDDDSLEVVRQVITDFFVFYDEA